MKVDPRLRAAWKAHGNEPVDLIVHVQGATRERSAEVEAMGAEVKRRFRLTRTLSIRCQGKTAVKLLDLPWVERIEPDRPVKAFGR